ncbi:lamin tail domain-containing protein [Saccharomonospora sp. NPDC046836]|uniref:lamin tail domain-containing protein n=1 Tax=Saccharomonospora sp. NPDC046836 TaxID=3156921 RepID=UPI0033DE700E
MRKRTMAVLTAVAVALLTGLSAAPAQAAGGVMIYRAYYNSPGPDTRSNASLNAEYIQLKNTTKVTKYVTGWTLRDRQNHIYRFPTTKIGPGQTLYVRTGKGTNNANNRYWGRTSYVWNNTGDAAYLRNSRGALIDSCSWGSSGSWKYC